MCGTNEKSKDTTASLRQRVREMVIMITRDTILNKNGKKVRRHKNGNDLRRDLGLPTFTVSSERYDKYVKEKLKTSTKFTLINVDNKEDTLTFQSLGKTGKFIGKNSSCVTYRINTGKTSTVEGKTYTLHKL